MSKLKLKLLLCGLLIFVFYAWGFGVHAAEVVFDAGQTYIDSNGDLSVSLWLNSPDKNINALEGDIDFSDSLRIKEIYDGGSVVNFWVDKPAVKGHTLHFSGITPGGYNANKGLILKMLISSDTRAPATLTTKNIKAYLNDGLGTSFLIPSQTINVMPVVGNVYVSQTKDVTPPERFKPEVGSSPTIFDGKKFVAFATQDKDSGIDHYEVAESSINTTDYNSKDLNWQTAISPKVLDDQNLTSYIYVKAVDHAGNIRVAVVNPQSQAVYNQFLFWVIIIVLILILAYVVSKKGRNRSI